MRRCLILILTVIMTLSLAAPVMAAEGNVTYEGDAGSFVFQPGSEYSPTDLFPNFKDVMPGDTLSQPITVKNDASKKVKVKIYMRSLGAHEGSEDFLSQLDLTVSKSADNDMSYMFDADANKTAQLTDWVLLGTLYSGGTVNLDVTLKVPGELDEKYSSQVGYLDWQFKVDEFPVDKDDPKPPKTGDDFTIYKWLIPLTAALAVMIVLLRRKRQEEE